MDVTFFLTILFIFICVVGSIYLHIIPSAYHSDINTFGNIGLIIATIGGLYTYTSDKEKESLLAAQRYIDTIIDEFNKIDDYLRNDYDNLKHIFKIVYNKLQMPSSNTEKVEFILEKIPNKEKDMTFLLFNKISYLCEKIYLTDSTLFDNDRLGLKLRLYIENELYYEYWQINKVIYDTKFVDFMENRFRFLRISDTRFSQADNTIYKIPASTKRHFMFL